MFRRMYVIIRELRLCVLLSYIKIDTVCDKCETVFIVSGYS
jgi:hypothetical protein